MKISLKHLFMPLVVLAYVGVAVTFLSPIFTTSSRWAVSAAFFVYLIFRHQVLPVLRMKLTLIMLIYCAWGITTTLWSERQELSLLKSIAAMFVTLPVLAGGFLWSREHDFEDVLNVLLPLTVAALLAGLLGRFSTAAIVHSGKTVLYQGLVNGPNMFGSMLAMCSPLLIWKVRQHWNDSRKQKLWLAAGLIATYYLLGASSRGAIMVVLTTLGFFFTSVPMARRVQIGILAVIGIGMVFMVAPNKFEDFKQHYIYKQGSEKKGVLYTRQDVWQESYEKAKEGGMFGGGYGVSIGNQRQFNGGLSAVGYGREKGNSQLAIVEEVGLVGFGMYLFLMVMLFGRLLITLATWPSGKPKQVLLLVTGLLVGMTVGSLFEAWWVAPGSPEYVYFWAMAGVGLGLTTYKPQSHLKGMTAPIKRRHRRQVHSAGDGATA